jgi:hydroxyethylthiazole kinase-like uncharacterized protein yjeF
MIEVRSVAEIRAAEEAAFAVLPDGALMQRAAMALAVSCARLLRDVRGGVVGARVVLLVGSGNNGGDALFAGALLAGRGARVDVVPVGGSIHDRGAETLRRAGGRFPDSTGAAELLAAADLVVDGILGIGGRGGLREPAASMIAHAGEAIVVAVDVPSGVDADTGAVQGAAVTADVTVTFGAMKAGLLVGEGRAHSGTVQLVDIGLGFAAPARCTVLESLDVARWLPEPGEDDYKYRRGVVGISAGSGPYPGAALLAVGGARHANVGMVRYLDRADGAAGAVVEAFPDIVLDGAPPSQQTRADAWGCGSGFVGSDDDEPVVLAVLEAALPVVIDAGALRVLAASAAAQSAVHRRWSAGLPTVLTPHDGEFERLRPGVLASTDRMAAAMSAARELSSIVVLKGPGTIIAAPDGSVRIDAEATSALATAGSGDVLMGVVSAVIAGAWARGQRDADSLLDAIAAAVWIHGRCGRVAQEEGPVVATDLIAALPAAVDAARFGS